VFRLALSYIRIGQCTLEDWEVLSSRTKARVSREEVVFFNQAVRLYAKKDAVYDYNHAHLRELEKPVIAIRANHTGQDAEKADT
jgi:hypothetical protein